MRLVQSLSILAAVGMIVSQWFIFEFAPVEQHMGLVQKIFYIHLPLAWWALMSFFVVFVASIAYLKSRKTAWDNLAKAAAEIGVVFAGLTIISGSIWGRHSWGVWWTWDPRLSTALVMWFVYAGYLILRGLDMPRERNANIRAVLGIIAFIDVPLVFLSARLWRSIHPAVFASEGGGLDTDMKITVFVCLAAFGFVFATLLLLRKKQLEHEDKLTEIFLQRHDEIS